MTDGQYKALAETLAHLADRIESIDAKLEDLTPRIAVLEERTTGRSSKIDALVGALLGAALGMMTRFF